MKKVLFILGVIVIIGAAVFFSKQNSDTRIQKLEIAATTFPVYDIARNIAGEQAVVHLIVPPGTSPHAFDVSPQTIKKISGSDILFGLGLGVDDWIASVQHALPGVPFVTLERNITLKESAAEGHEQESEDEHEEHEEHGPTDPHYWLDPDNAKIMAATITEELSKIDPDHAAEYQVRKDAFVRRIEEKDKEWQARLTSFTKRDILTFHDAFYYFADHFNLRVVATYEPFAGKEPSPQYLAELHTIVKKYDIRTLFIEPQLSRSGLDAFAADVGAAIGVLDEMGGQEGKESYIALIDANVREVENALRK